MATIIRAIHIIMIMRPPVNNLVSSVHLERGGEEGEGERYLAPDCGPIAELTQEMVVNSSEHAGGENSTNSTNENENENNLGIRVVMSSTNLTMMIVDVWFSTTCDALSARA